MPTTKEISEKWQESLNITKQKTVEKKLYQFGDWEGPLSSFLNVKTLKLIKSSHFKNFPKKVKPNVKIDCSLRIKKSLNGYTILDTQSQLVIKGLEAYFEPRFLENELNSVEYYPSNTIASLCKKRIDQYDVIVYPYIDEGRHGQGAPVSTVYLHSLLLGSKSWFKIEPLSRELAEARNHLHSVAQSEHNLLDNKTTGEIVKKLTILLDKCKDVDENIPIVSKMVHGDLVDSNVMKQSDKIILIDWANGGIHNFLYDLIVVNFYDHSTQFWDTPFGNDFREQSSNSGKSLLDVYSEYYRLRTNMELANDLVFCNTILSLCELFLKNYWRHQNEKSTNDGDSFMKHFERITEILFNAQNAE